MNTRSILLLAFCSLFCLWSQAAEEPRNSDPAAHASTSKRSSNRLNDERFALTLIKLLEGPFPNASDLSKSLKLNLKVATHSSTATTSSGAGEQEFDDWDIQLTEERRRGLEVSGWILAFTRVRRMAKEDEMLGNCLRVSDVTSRLDTTKWRKTIFEEPYREQFEREDAPMIVVFDASPPGVQCANYLQIIFAKN